MTKTLPDLAGVDWIRLGFVDLFGVGHTLHLPVGRFAEVVERGVAFDGSAMEGRARSLEADMLLVPDPATLICWRGRVAQVVCSVCTAGGDPWPADPRGALAAAVDRLGDLGRDYTVSAELELYLLRPDASPVDGGGYYDDDDGVGIGVARAAAARLIEAGVAVDGVHHEAGPGQVEIDLGAAGPLVLCDALILAKQLVREEAAAVGLRATFMARPLDGHPGSGLHLHQRVGDLLVDLAGTLTKDGAGFVAGQLAHAKALSALAAPTVNSYKRLHSGPEAPGAVVWAHHNRAALIRVGSRHREIPSVEYRGADPAANPYLLVAGLLAAAADGLEQEMELAAPSDEDVGGGFDPLAATMRFDPLPRDLDGALDALLLDEVILDTFDGQLINRLVDARRAESVAYGSRVTPWELEHAFDQPGDGRAPGA